MSALDTPGISTPRVVSVLRNAATMIHGTRDVPDWHRKIGLSARSRRLPQG
jgi:hypothetical protein